MSVTQSQSLLSILESGRITTCCNLASLAVLVYDHTLTLGLEVKLVWPAPWSLAKILFFSTKYLVFTDVLLNLSFHLAPASASPKLCTCLYLLSGSLIMIGILISELTLVFRTWVIWGHNRKIALILLSTVLLMIVPTSFLAYFGWKTVKFSASPVPRLLSCWMSSSPGRVLFAGYVLICIFESAILVLTIYRGVQHFQFSRSKLAVTLYRDGLMYYVFLLGFSLLNIVIIVLAPGASLILMQRVFHSIFTVRMLINLREAAHRDLAQWGATSTCQRSGWSIPEPAFASNPESTRSNAV